MKTIRQALKQHANPPKANVLKRFFRTGKGEYGEGDIFLGVMVPDSRKVAQKFLHVNLEELIFPLKSKIHEERLVALLILVEKYKKAKKENEKKEIVDFYLKHKYAVNNWDLVDLTADKILGNYLLNKKRNVVYELADSSHLWDKRMAIVSTFAFIRAGEFEDTFKICQKLLKDKHDLLHKACGWMLREVGKKDEKALETFLEKNYRQMPRTMLRYAIERFSEQRRKAYLNGKV